MPSGQELPPSGIAPPSAKAEANGGVAAGPGTGKTTPPLPAEPDDKECGDNPESLAATDIRSPEIIRALGMSLRKSMSISASPYASPKVLRAYDEEYRQGFSDKVVQTIDNQIAHRQALERAQVLGAERRKDRGQVFGFAVALGSFVAAAVFHLIGMPAWISFGAMVLGIGGPSAAIVAARALDRRREEPPSAPKDPG